MSKGDRNWLPDPDTWKGTWRDDWRIIGQEGYLMDKTLQYREFDQKLVFEDFDHCEFCFDHFEDGCRVYCEPSKPYWICEECFSDFKENFHWKVEK